MTDLLWLVHPCDDEIIQINIGTTSAHAKKRIKIYNFRTFEINYVYLTNFI